MSGAAQIIAIGGQTYPRPAGETALERYILDQSGKRRPTVCFLPTASGESAERILGFYEAFGKLECEPSWLSLFHLPTADLEGFLLEKDALFVGGGNTRSMLALWREWGLDTILRKAFDAGVVLAGSSAGANCWFEQCTTDSVPGELRMLPCLGLLSGSFTPHFDVEADRRPTLHRLLSKREILGGYAVDNDTALHLIDGNLSRAVSSRSVGRAFRVELDGAEIVEQPLPVEILE